MAKGNKSRFKERTI